MATYTQPSVELRHIAVQDIGNCMLVLSSDEGVLEQAIYFEGNRVGHASAHFEDQRMVLTDLRIESAFVMPAASFVGRLVQRLTAPAPLDFRGRGLGNLLLNNLIRAAEQRHTISIEVIIPHDALVATPHLMHWLERHGFKAALSDEVTGVVKVKYTLQPKLTDLYLKA